MYHASVPVQNITYADYAAAARQVVSDRMALACDWSLMHRQLLAQWHRLTKADLDDAGPDRHKIAALVQRKYGISAKLVENYLAHLARTLPMI